MPRGIYIRTEETKNNLSKSHKGQLAWNKGIPTSEETKKKLSDSHKGQRSWNKGKKTGVIPTSAFKKGFTPWNKGKKLPQFSGENACNWKGGVTPIHNKLRGSIEGKLWIQSVFARDGYTCQKTGVKGGRLTAHHVLNFAQYPELRFAIDNGVTLSIEAHNEFHKRYGKKDNTREQLEEFLKSTHAG